METLWTPLPWWVYEWERDGFLSFLDWCGETFISTHNTVYSTDFSTLPTDQLYDTLKRIASAYHRLYGFHPDQLNGYDVNGVLGSFRQRLQEEKAEEPFIHMCCFFVSFMVIASRREQAQEYYQIWVYNDSLRIPLSFEFLRRQAAPEDIADMPAFARDMSMEQHKELIRRLKSSKDPRFAQLNALAANLLGDPDAENRYFEHVYSSWINNVNFDDDDERSAINDAALEVWNKARQRSHDDFRSVCVGNLNDDIVIRSFLTRARQRKTDLRRKEYRRAGREVLGIDEGDDSVSQSVRSSAIAPIELEIDDDVLASIECRSQEVREQILSLYNAKRARNFCTIYDKCLDLLKSGAEWPDNKKMAKLTRCSLSTIERFWAENRVHGWLKRS